ncbi:MAG: hypothetical protein NC548_64995 [Lachnospiraceae bacterium]|nr:hypothetical protein [Lachnospiraceae bacterium]MCM1235978.1 hypothetical protein [Ruminococcus flavefaciens]
MENRGYQRYIIFRKCNASSVIVEKKCGEYNAKLESFEMIEDLITHELYAQEDIAEMVSYMVEQSHNQSDGEAIVRVR